MGCGSCGSGGCGSTGCGRNGGCATGGCNKLNTYDWLGNMLSPDLTEADNVYEVRFKNTRKGFYRNVHGLRLYLGDRVVVESDRGYDIGTLSLGGVVARLQMKKKHVGQSPVELPRIFRKANDRDLEQYEAVRERDDSTRIQARTIIEELGLDMKLSDVEFQGDNSKAIFYYIADHRVDFRELIKVLAREFRIRVEMKQIGLRHEAGLVGGIGSCGRELCCSTWLTDFKTVSTTAARYQNLSLNPMKISGLCGRLKCCLNYELDVYLDALSDFPDIQEIPTKKGKARLQKTDIFKRKMWFSYEKETTWYPLMVSDVKRLLAQVKQGNIPDSLGRSIIIEKEVAAQDTSLDFVDVVGNTFPKEQRKNKQGKNSNRKKKSGRNRNPSNSSKGRPQNQQGDRKQGERKQGERSPSNRGSSSKGRGRSNSNQKKANSNNSDRGKKNNRSNSSKQNRK